MNVRAEHLLDVIVLLNLTLYPPTQQNRLAHATLHTSHRHRWHCDELREIIAYLGHIGGDGARQIVEVVRDERYTSGFGNMSHPDPTPGK